MNLSHLIADTDFSMPVLGNSISVLQHSMYHQNTVIIVMSIFQVNVYEKVDVQLPYTGCNIELGF